MNRTRVPWHALPGTKRPPFISGHAADLCGLTEPPGPRPRSHRGPPRRVRQGGVPCMTSGNDNPNLYDDFGVAASPVTGLASITAATTSAASRNVIRVIDL